MALARGAVTGTTLQRTETVAFCNDLPF